VSGWASLRAWLRGNPLMADVALAVAVLALGLLGEPNPDPTSRIDQTPTAVVALVVACSALVWRRRSPLLVWATALAACVAAIAGQHGPSPAVLAVMITVYTVATLRRGRIGVGVAAATAAVLIGTVVGVPGYPSLMQVSYTIVAVTSMACAVGIAVRGNRARVLDAVERARVAEHTREEEAQRQVTEERLRIARELHDVVAHHIAAINVQAGVARHLVESDAAAAREALQHVRESGQVVLDEMGTLLGLLRSPGEEDLAQPAQGLDQVGALLEEVRRRGTAVSWRVSGASRALSPGADLAAYRLIQESLTNAGRHGTGAAHVALEYGDRALVVEVVNPVPAGARPSGGGGLGLLGMRERVAAVGGNLVTGRRPNGAFAVVAELPLESTGGSR
jgi:signal transduction histidine kinase